MGGRVGVRISAVAACLALLALTGCGGSQDGEVRDLADEFYRAVADGDGAAACALLVPATRSELEQSSGKECATAILEEAPKPGDGGTVEVYGTMAQVRLGGETAFLTRMSRGWRVLAVACTPRAEKPYDCAVKGA